MRLSKKDLTIILDIATKEYSSMPIPYYLDGESVEGHSCVNLSVVIATISFLNWKGLLKENVVTENAQWIKHDGE